MKHYSIHCLFFLVEIIDKIKKVYLFCPLLASLYVFNM
ncbi:hypothetical protein EUBDOL_00164 [Amedibacillus dolichus DSM 3991]|uniref:Uncharacterized protein n=1 Tax=Amedibacillus dolichus DSM 3991 TaxID=428127 RepID=A8R831_9FIRM|nr:hypothetical protein EUBDOL_00164 [Amedibacillus dolichus DSM 3991]